VVIEEKINDEYNDGIRSAVKGSADSPHTGTVSATGLNCAFRYFEKPAGDPLSEASEDIRKFIADGRSFDIAWRANGDAFFVLRKEVQEKEKQDVLQDMRSLFGEYDNYYVVVDGKTYSLHEPNEVERKRGIKGVSKIIADAEPAMEEEEESAADAGRGPEPPAVRPREGPSSAPPERSADAAVKGRPTDDAQGRADRGGIELASKVVPDPKAPPPPLPRAPEPVPASSPTVADALRMKMADERAFIEAGGMRFVADDEFRVNTDPDEHYFVIADRETGERAIASRLVDGSDREEGWVYVEGTVETDEDGDGIKEERTVTIWFECGVGEKDGALDTKHIERFLKSDLFGRFTNVKEPSVYHQHPIDKGGVWSEKSIYPSDADLEVAVERLSPLFKGRSYDFNVITSCGVYTLTVPAGMRKIDKKMLARYREDIVGRTFKTPDRCQDMVCKTGLSCKFKYFDPKMKAVLGRVEKVYGMQKLIRDINVEMQRTTVDQRALAAKKAELRSIINGLPADIKAKYNYLAAFDPAGLTTSQLNQIKVQLRNALLDVLEKEIGGSELSRGYPAFEKQVSNFIHTLRLGGSEELAKK
jgi:hypothetical protein